MPSLGSDSTVTTLQEEFQIGRKVYSNIKSSQTFFDYPLLEDFIMHKLSKLLLSDKFSEEQRYSNFQSFNRVKIFFIDDEKLNAFALPANFIGINKGLITKVKDHRELFAVLCHEIAHLTQRHISRRYSARKDSNNLMLMAALLSALIIGTGGTDSALGALSLGQTMAMKKELEFSRHAENEADKKGMEYLLDLQIHPKYITQMLDRIQQQTFLTGRNETSSFTIHIRVLHDERGGADSAHGKDRLRAIYLILRRVLESKRTGYTASDGSKFNQLFVGSRSESNDRAKRLLGYKVTLEAKRFALTLP